MKFLEHGLFGWSLSYVLTHPWIIPGEVYRRTKWFVQRGWRGYSDRDNWGIDGFLLEILPPMLENLKHGYGYPSEFDSQDEWVCILEQMIVGFRANRTLMDLEYDWRDTGEKEALQIKSDGAFRLFVKYFNNLWD